MKSKKLLGFTLIELLIVIAIIGILAVAFLPSLLNAPAKGRDTQRIADMQKIQKVLVSKDLEGKGYPSTSGAIADALATGWAAPNAAWSSLAPDFGGALPKDPQATNVQYKYFAKAAGEIGTYSFGLVAKMETAEAGNAECVATTALPAANPYVVGVKPTTAATSCYVILMK